MSNTFIQLLNRIPAGKGYFLFPFNLLALKQRGYKFVHIYYTNRELRMQRFYLTFSDILHVAHSHFPFLY